MRVSMVAKRSEELGFSADENVDLESTFIDK
jgi:hypothetical protein